MDFGSNPERAASFKLIGNSMIIATIEMLSECMTLADKTGVGADRLCAYPNFFIFLFFSSSQEFGTRTSAPMYL